MGTTLNPYYEGNDTGRMISDDRFIRTTLRDWFFGRDDSGDLMSADNMLVLMDRAEVLGSVLLVRTAAWNWMSGYLEPDASKNAAAPRNSE